MKTKRSYTMGARAEAVEETRRRILRGAAALASRRTIASISLEDIANEAGVSVQTVLRQFGNRGGVVDAAMGFATAEVLAERASPVGDAPVAVRHLVDHYERAGDTALLLLAQEGDDQAQPVLDNARRVHRQWVRDTFAPQAAGDEEIVDLLVVATDVYAWKLLRRDRGLSRTHTERRMLHLVEAILGHARKAG